MFFKYCYFQDKIVEVSTASVSWSDLGLLRGYGVFDYLRTYNGHPFLASAHLSRFMNSTAALGMSVSGGVDALRRGMQLVLDANNIKPDSGLDCGVRFVLTGGASEDGISLPIEPSFAILAESLSDYDADETARGFRLITSEFQRELPRVKTTNYLNAVRLQPQMVAAGATEILYHSRGFVLEASRSNVFIFVGNVLVTPLDDILLGNTRRVVIETARSVYRVEERPLNVEELGNADEVFITGTGKRIAPIISIDGKPCGNGLSGMRTMHLAALFNARIATFRGED